jgi:hypothetical protein
MSDSPLMSKMDALLKKHRGGGANLDALPGRAPPADAWLPVLNDVIERGTPPVATVAAPIATPPVEPVEATEGTPPSVMPNPADGNALAEQLLSELAPRLSEVMEKQVAAELRRNLDETVANLLGQLDINVREIVRDAVAEKLKQPREP